ncbi:MAG TPA: right-handed parallel beta-helix repeat-containing protein [Solirubrobacterales bacterium]|nr:right-handed parallel beta-helix repeat-containing protein [Solirubrobacterales bacterium]
MPFVEVGGRRRAGLIAAALIALVCALALPVAAAAEQYEVNSTADEPAVVVGVCASAGGKCTLRAAIQASNSTPADDDTIIFDETVFEGQLADMIAIGPTPLPAITDKVLIQGRQCTTQAGDTGPCQGISGPDVSSSALTIENTDQVEIESLAVTGARTGINISGGSAEVRVKGSWLGVKLDGSDGGNEVGVFVDPESNGVRIGGESPEARNVFAYNDADGLQILGADNAIVLGNYFGVAPDRETPAANSENVEVASQLAGGFVATGNLIGVQAESEASGTEECDRGCNVIAGATASGVDLQGNSVQGESPAVETHVAGNFIGLAADGTTVVPNAASGIEGAAGVKVGAAAKTVIGGLEVDGSEANFFAGGAYGIYIENADGFQVIGNQIGFDPGGDAVASPSQVGVFAFCLSSVEPGTIEENEIGMDSGIAIEQRFLGATIFGNFIEGGETGILATASGASGNLIERNLILEAAGNGILIKSDSNEVLGNFVIEAGAAGIRVEHAGTPPLASATTENRIGGDSEEEENAIFGSGGDAIEIVDFEATANEVARNFGAFNGGLFIDLVATNPGTEPNGPNGGIKPPSFSTSTQSSASGSGAKEGAVIRVFTKESAEPGELEFFLAETQADAAGNWKVAYPGQIPTGTIVAATQTSKGATSELTTATSTADPVKPPTCATAPAMCARPPGPAPQTPAPGPPIPQTKIDKGRQGKSESTTATFKFSSSVKGSTFQCKLDKGKFKSCKSPKKYKKLKPGKHVFKVRAVNSAGQADPSPAQRKFTVLG